MQIAPKIADFNIVDIDTTQADVESSPGMAGVAIIQQGQAQGLQTYYSLDDVAGDYANNSYAYQAASNYFNNPNATTFQVISYPNVNQEKPTPIPDDLKPLENVDIQGLINASKQDNLPCGNYLDSHGLTDGNLTGISDFPGVKNLSNIIDDITQAVPSKENKHEISFSQVKAKYSSYFNSSNPMIKSITNSLLGMDAGPQSYALKIAFMSALLKPILDKNKAIRANTNPDPAVTALTKYYKSGAEFFVFEVASQADEQTAIDLSNLVEGQQNGMLFLDQPTQAIGTDDDFKWYQPIVNNRSTVLFSMPYSGDPAGYQFVPNILSRYAGGNPSSNLELTNNLPNIEPQDYYNFTDQDFQVYQKNGVITYCYRNDIPMLSSGNSASRYQVSNMITRDYLNSQIGHGISGAIIAAHNDGKDIKFDQNGVNYIVSIIRMTLSSAAQAGYIKNPVVHGVDANKIPENVKEEGYLNGLSYDWAPNNNINKATFHQVINVPLMAQK